MILSGATPELHPTQSAERVETNCPDCQQLGLLHAGWIEIYQNLVRLRKASLLQGRLPSQDLNAWLARAECELNQMRSRMTEHRAQHSFLTPR